MKRTSAFVLILFGTVGGGVSHWFVVWLLAAAYGAADLGHYSVLLAGATPIFIFLGLGLKDAYVSLSDAPSWRYFFLWRSGGMTIGLLLLTVYCLAAAPYWGIFAGMAVMKVADGFLDISLGRLQRLSKFNTLGALSSAHAVVSIIVISIAAWLSAPVGVLVGATGVVSLVITVPALVLSRTPSPVPASRTVQWRRVLNAALPLTASTGLMSLLASIPIWFLEAYSEPSEVGRFAAAAYLIVAANLMGASVQTILITTYRNRLETTGRHSLMRAMNVHTGLLALAGVPAVAIIVLAGDLFLRLVYGEEFGASSLELFAFGTAALLCTLGYVNAATMLVLNWYRGQLVVTVASLVGAVIPLLAMAALGTQHWVLAGTFSMVGAYLVRYTLSRLLLNARKADSHVTD